MPIIDFWTIWMAADSAGARRLHLATGRPPMARAAGGELAAVAGFDADLAPDDVMRLLSTLVEPDDWAKLERNGDGEMAVFSPTGARVSLTVFRANQLWSAVARWG